jgi:hypothetical protein
MSAKVMDFERGSRRCWIGHTGDFLAFLTCGWMQANAQRIRAQRVGPEDFGVQRRCRGASPSGCSPKEVLMAWAREWAKEGLKVDWEHLCCQLKASRCYLVDG